jgi:hypothetical protein
MNIIFWNRQDCLQFKRIKLICWFKQHMAHRHAGHGVARDPSSMWP